MRGAVISFFLIFAIMLGSTHASAVAHAHGDNVAQVIDMLDSDHHAIDGSHDADGTDDVAPDGAGDVAQHHHCSVSLSDVGPGICHRTALDGSKPVPSLPPTLASITSAPLIEPPSA